MRMNRSTACGFTIVELLVVIAIVAILIALLVPAVQYAREAARRTKCTDNLKQIGLAIHNYHDNNNAFPPGWIGVTGDEVDVNGLSGFGWASMILPMMERGNLYYGLNFRTSMTDSDNSLAHETFIPSFRCPTDTGPRFWEIGLAAGQTNDDLPLELPTANYVGSFGSQDLHECENNAPGENCSSNGIFHLNSHLDMGGIKDGTATTLLVGERRSDTSGSLPFPWHTTWVGAAPGGEESFARILASADHPPNDPSLHFEDFSSWHDGGAIFVFCDGKVQFISDNIDEDVFRSLATTRGNDLIGDF